jgi:opacity protein-like surface antigen
MGYEMEAQYSYVGAAKTETGRHSTGNVTEQNGLVRLLVTPQWGQGPIYRLGVSAQRYAFGLPSNAPIPNTLQSTSLVLGLDFQLGESWIGRVEVEPGLYGDFQNPDTGDFNAPFILGVSYIASASLQWVAGVSVDVYRRYPVIPAVGVRWSVGSGWTINAVLPTPRLEYAWSKPLTLYAGAEFKDIAYRVGDDFGDQHGRPKLNEAIMEYDEVRVGAGLSWKATSAVSLELEGGYMPYRDFNFHRADFGLKTKQGAPYGQVAFSAKF